MKGENLFMFPIRIVGSRYCEKDVVRSVIKGEQVFLEREPENEYDHYAVAVFVERDGEKQRIGYVPKKELACTGCGVVANAWDKIEICPECKEHFSLMDVNKDIFKELADKGKNEFPRSFFVKFQAVKGKQVIIIIEGIFDE